MGLVTVNDIGWSRYLDFEGPFFGGRVLYVLPHGATFEDKVMAVVTETEGGRFDAVNMYDSCILTVGAVQWCDRGMFGVCELLGFLAPEALGALAPALALANARVARDAKGRFRFEFIDGRGLVDTEDEQRLLYFGSAHVGKQGTWDAHARMHAKTWAACMANLWVDPRACDAQTKYTTARLVNWYAWSTAKRELWDGGEAPDGYVGAMRAAYISYAANMPGIALKMFEMGLISAQHKGFAKWSREWCEEILKQMVFGPKIAIYPGRYNRIRPVLERIFGIDLTDTALQLSGFDAADTSEVQKMLIALGFDLGPSGADGIMGKKTKSAIVLFQSMNGLAADGVVGPLTLAKLREKTA